MIVRVSALIAIGTLVLVPAAWGAAARAPDQLGWLKSGDYAALEHYYSHAQRAYESGKLDDQQLYARFRELYQDTPNNKQYFDGWVRRYPNSYSARVARGAYLYRMAWSARGDAYAYQTTAGRFAGMRQYLALARPDLLASLTMTARPILSSLYLLNAAILIGSPAERGYWLERGDDIDPANSLVRLRYMFSLRPRWGGSYTQMNSFLQHCSAQHLDPQLIARMAMLIHSDLADDAVAAHDSAATFRESGEVISLAGQAHQSVPTDSLVEYTRAAWDLRRKADADWGLQQLSTTHLDSAWSLSQIGWIYAEEHRNDKAWPLLTQAASLNDPWSQFVVGKTIYLGCPDLNLAANRPLGLAWIRRAAEQCLPDARKYLQAHGQSAPAECLTPSAML